MHTPEKDMCPLKGTVSGSWSLGILEQLLGEGCCLLQRYGERECEGIDCGRIRLWRRTRQPHKQGDITESHVCGWSNHHSLSLPMSYLQGYLDIIYHNSINLQMEKTKVQIR